MVPDSEHTHYHEHKMSLLRSCYSVRWRHEVRHAPPGPDQGGLQADGEQQHVAVGAGWC